jgi:hypothetical protein
MPLRSKPLDLGDGTYRAVQGPVFACGSDDRGWSHMGRPRNLSEKQKRRPDCGGAFALYFRLLAERPKRIDRRQTNARHGAAASACRRRWWRERIRRGRAYRSLGWQTAFDEVTRHIVIHAGAATTISRRVAPSGIAQEPTVGQQQVACHRARIVCGGIEIVANHEYRC